MGTVWVFKPTREHTFADLCVSRMVERFGRDDANWEEVRLEFMSKEVSFTSFGFWSCRCVAYIEEKAFLGFWEPMIRFNYLFIYHYCI